MFFKKKQNIPDESVILNIITNLSQDSIPKDNIAVTITADKISALITVPENIKINFPDFKKQILEKLSKKYSNYQSNIAFTQEMSVPKPPSPKPIEGIKKIIAVASGKGGVGKSTIALHLALSYAKLGFKVGLADADIHGPSIARMLGLSEAPEIKDNKMIPPERFGIKCMSMGFLLSENAPVVWRGPMVTKALHQLMLGAEWNELDVLIIDLPPGTGDIQLSLAQNYMIDGVILVSTPQEIALLDVKKAATMFNKLKLPIIGIIENMAYLPDNNGNKNYIFGSGAVKKFCSDSNIKYLGEIPLNSSIAANCDSAEHSGENNITNLFKELIVNKTLDL